MSNLPIDSEDIMNALFQGYFKKASSEIYKEFRFPEDGYEIFIWHNEKKDLICILENGLYPFNLIIVEKNRKHHIHLSLNMKKIGEI